MTDFHDKNLVTVVSYVSILVLVFAIVDHVAFYPISLPHVEL